MRIWHSESVRGFSLALLCLVCVIYPLLAGSGPVNTRGGGDSPFLLVRLEELVAGLRAGAFPVRWMPDAAYGLGYPFLNFYAALPYYVAAAFRLLGWGPIVSLQVTQALGFILAALAMALLARRVFQRRAAVVLAAVAYTCAPFHVVNVYVRGDSLSEFYAFVFYPLIVYALLRVRDNPTWLNAAWLGLSYGGLILTHNLSAIMFSPFVALYALFLLVPRHGEQSRRAFWQRIEWRTALLMVAGGALGLALSATLWLTIVGDLRSVWMGARDIQTTGFFNYQGHLRGRDLVQTSVTFDYDVSPGHTPFAMGLVQAGTIGAGIIALLVGWLRRKNQCAHWHIPVTAFWLAGLLLSTWLITPLSEPLWAHLPVLPVVQFPWRFLSVQAFFGALIVGELATQLPRPWWVATVLTVLLLVATVGNLQPEHLPIDERDVTPDRLALFESFTTNIGTTIRGEYLPVAVEPRPYASAWTLGRGREPAPAALVGDIAHAELVRRNARSEQWQVQIDSDDAHLAFRTLYFPGWQARVDGEPAEIEPLSGSGWISIHVPRGAHTVDLHFGRTTGRWIADLLSLSAAAGTVALLWPLIRVVGSVLRKVILTAIFGAAALLGVLVLLGGMLSAPAEIRSDDDLSMDFDRMPFLHHNPDGIDFGPARLARYAYDQTVRGGEVLDVTLDWDRNSPNLVARMSLVVPSDMHPDLKPSPAPLAQAEAHIEGSTTVHSLAVPADAASGSYYLALQVFDGPQEIRATSTDGRKLGTSYLRPVWIHNPRPAKGDDPILANFGDHILLRDDVQVDADDSGWEVKLTWQATRPIAVNYTCLLRVLGTDGTPLAQRDFEGGPGYGFWPTSAWPTGEWLTDRLRLPRPARVGDDEAVALHVVLYDRSQDGYPAVGSAIVPLAERVHRYVVPPIEQTVGAVYGEQVELLGYDTWLQDGTWLHITFHWQAVQRIARSWAVFVHLLDPDTGTIVSQWDASPLHGTYPTNGWRVGEIVSDEIVLDLREVPPGGYRLGVGLYDAATSDRMPVTTASGEPARDGRLILEQVIEWRGAPQ